jgi:polysaccharide export outer membrane protein
MRNVGNSRNNFSKHTVKIILPIFLIAVFFFTQGCASSTKSAKIEKPGINSAGGDTPVTDGKLEVQEYTLEKGDVLYIFVWQENDLSQEIIVRPDGKISFPLAGDIPVLGLTFTQLKDELTKRLKEYIKYPIVSISLRKLGGQKVIVLGEVTRPGVYSVTGKNTVLEAIALAGGFTEHAVHSSVILVRGGLQTPEGKRLDLNRAINKTDIGQNVTLQSEDIVYVPKKFIANVNYVLDQILEPISRGIYTIRGLQVIEGE